MGDCGTWGRTPTIVPEQHLIAWFLCAGRAGAEADAFLATAADARVTRIVFVDVSAVRRGFVGDDDVFVLEGAVAEGAGLEGDAGAGFNVLLASWQATWRPDSWS